MNRRAFLGASAGALATGLAGCLGQSGSAPVNHPGNIDTEFTANGDYPADENPGDGLPPQYGNPPESRSIDPSQYRALQVNGEQVTLVPTGVVRYWHRTREARFVDARPLAQYETSHIFGAVNSPAQRGSSGGGIGAWGKDDRVVCYCGCPHHLSSIRAAGLQKAGHSNVYVFDQGFYEWRDQGFPMRGTSFRAPESRVIRGQTAATYAGEYAWATHPDSGQQEAAPIGDDGSFELHLRFSGMSSDMPIRVATPGFEVTRPLGDLTDGVLTV